MKNFNDLCGQLFGTITVVEYSHVKLRGNYRVHFYKCICGCGREQLKSRNQLRFQKPSKCKKCSQSGSSNNNFNHGKTKHPLFNRWNSIKERCNNSNNKQYSSYGGRGIKICSSWENDFMNFYNWAINNGYDKKLSIDRINNNGNYEPENCRFSTMTIQTRNRRKLKINTSGFNGVGYLKKQCKWRSRISVKGRCIQIGIFDTKEQAKQARVDYIKANSLLGFSDYD